MVSMATVLAYAAGGLVTLWGVAHVIPTRRVLASFDPISSDNRRVILQEWLAEALTMWGMATVVVVVTVVAGARADATEWVYRATALLLVSLAGLTALTGARTHVIWFKICPVLLTASAGLLVAASLL
jgi:hypothetical protein